MTKILVVSDPQALFRAAAEQVVARANEAVAARGTFSIALSGGATPKGLYDLLVADDAMRKQMPWDKVQVWWGDERHVPPDDPQSNYRMAKEALLSRAPIPSENIHRVQVENPDAGKAAEDYESELRRIFKLDAPAFPRFDLILLGMGPEGHTASLFPGTKALSETERLVAVNWVGKLFTRRLTFTAPLINNARAVVFLVAGDDKALALKGVLEGPIEPDQLPAQIVQPTDGELVWLLDKKAAALLEPATINENS